MIMSTQATAYESVPFTGEREAKSAKPGFMARLYAAFVEAQTRAARARVARELNGLPVEHLKALGLEDPQIQSLRKDGKLPF